MPTSGSEEHEVGAGLVDRFIRKVTAIATDELRAAAAAAELSALPPAEAASLLGRLIRLSRDRDQAATAVGAVDRALMRGDLDPEFTEAARACARSRADRLVEALLAAGPAVRAYDQNDEQFIDKRMRALSLGQRRALSRSADIDQLVRLAHDQDPRVIEDLLRNPRLTEREAVIIASRRPTHLHVLEAVLASRFGASRRVRRAVAHNPYASVAQAMRALVTLPLAELRLVAEDEHVAVDVRRHARSLCVNRRPTPAERAARAAPPLDTNEAGHWVRRLEAEAGDDAETIEVVPSRPGNRRAD